MFSNSIGQPKTRIGRLFSLVSISFAKFLRKRVLVVGGSWCVGGCWCSARPEDITSTPLRHQDNIARGRNPKAAARRIERRKKIRKLDAEDQAISMKDPKDSSLLLLPPTPTSYITGNEKYQMRIHNTVSLPLKCICSIYCKTCSK